MSEEKTSYAPSNGDEFDCPVCGGHVSSEGVAQEVCCPKCQTRFVHEATYMVVRWTPKEGI